MAGNNRFEQNPTIRGYVSFEDQYQMEAYQHIERYLRTSFEASLALRVARAERVRLQNAIPNHWFSAAASECAAMYVAGHFYGSISVAQAYVESSANYLCAQHAIRRSGDVPTMWRRLMKAGFIETDAHQAAESIYSDRNSFHHLNDRVEQDHTRLEARALNCVNHLHVIESGVFAYTFDRGHLVPKSPKYWPQSATQAGMIDVYIRNIGV